MTYMEEHITLKTILDAVQGVKNEVQSVKTDVQDVKNEVQSVKTDVQGVKDEVQGLKETVEFIKENAVTKDELKEELKKVRDDIATHVDGFIRLYKNHDSELAAVMSRQERQEKKIEKIMVHVGMQPDMT